ncbi:hypothetical protein SAMN05216421_0552 [Halopseudomonas xinjiangensis]|uniref:Thioesterase family protein n=1 Tax=Halopseudomonas xinjiangensis TaxID=487184 RepID=A0A1H1MVJ5_9GAMM|nr:hotdog fold domain-containing protein [Halopseudomonas xinjiangensis]SDR90873.1 hypothetical protein SAMN05216421_0552 [Halopseudomonas xinjiangensis]
MVGTVTLLGQNITIASRFCGPPQSGNGGYVAGLLAKAMPAGCQVTLHAPPPLDAPLTLSAADDGMQLHHEGRLLASARPYELAMTVPPAPSIDASSAAQQRFEGIVRHDLPGCFVCGPNRDPGDGLRIFAGPLDDPKQSVAALWTPDASLADRDETVASEFLWAALDCPGFFAVRPVSGLALLGRFAARLLEPVRVGETLIVNGWAIRHDGRKHQTGTALYRENGSLVAFAEATWISIPGR